VKSLKTEFVKFWCANFFGALFILLLLKFIMVFNNILGTEAFESPLKLLGKSFLFLGWDVVGAAILATIAAAVAAPLSHRGWKKSALAWSVVVQFAHGAFVVISAFTSIYIGSLINKAAIDLAFLNQMGEGGTGSGLAMSSSIGHHINIFNMSLIVLLPALASLVVWQYLRFHHRWSRWARRAVVGVVVTLASITVLLLPWLLNGDIAGIRVHTHGLERSPGVELASSYVSPMFRKLFGSSEHIADEFYFDMSTIAYPGTTLDNPLTRARPITGANVIVISLESVGQKYLREDSKLMPFLQGFGSKPGSMYFLNHSANWPQTMKAFFSIFCSELPYPDYKPITFVNPTVPCKSISEVTAEAGYRNLLITSADLAYDRKMRFFQHRRFHEVYDMRNMPDSEGVWRDSWGLDERLAVGQLLKFVRSNADKPFFIFYEMATAHHPYNSCQEHVDNPLDDDFAAYSRALGFIDDRIRDIVAGVEDAGLADRTLIVVYSDHGEGFGQHPGSRSHGPKVYQENLHVPFALLGPQLGEVSGRVDFSTSHIDVAPTVLGLIGINPPCTMKGRNLASSSEPRISLMGGRPPGGQFGVLDANIKYIIEDNGAEMLFDLSTDPDEENDIISGHRDLAAKYRKRLDEWKAFSSNLIPNYSAVLLGTQCK